MRDLIYLPYAGVCFKIITHFKSHSVENEEIGGHYGIQKSKSENWRCCK